MRPLPKAARDESPASDESGEIADESVSYCVDVGASSMQRSAWLYSEGKSQHQRSTFGVSGRKFSEYRFNLCQSPNLRSN